MKFFIVLHHSADPTQGPQFNKINASHKARGFPKSSMGYYVGYHWFIGFDGTVKQARKEEERGAHCDAKMMNYIGIGVCLAGDFTKKPPHPVQIEALSQLVSGIQERWGILDQSLLLHRECKPTACPGVNLRDLILAYRKTVQSPTVESPSISAMMARMYARRLQRLKNSNG